MAVRKPIVVVSGLLKELPSGDTIDTAAEGTVSNVSGASGLWIGTAASLPGTGTANVLYVTY